MSEKIVWHPNGTAGPWVVDGKRDISTESGVMVAVCYGWVNRTDLAAAAEVPAMVQALRMAAQFIENGVEFGYIRMPDPETPDSAHNTLPAIRAILSRIDAA